MDIVSKSIANNIRSGKYFIDARKWYFYKYIYPFSERSILLLLSSGFIISALLIIYYGLATLPISKEESFIIKVDNSLDYYSRIFSIADTKHSTEDDLSQYLASYYVQNRESYDYNSIQEQLQIVKNNSTLEIYNEFYKYISLSNPQSPIIILQKFNKRHVIINKVEKFADENKILVYFSDEIKGDNLNKKSNWVAEVTYDMPNINILAKNETRLNFVVTKYKVKEIKNDKK